MRIHLALKPHLRILDPHEEVGVWFARVIDKIMAGSEPPPTSFVLREWEVYDGRKHEVEQYELRLFMAEIRHRFKAFSSVVEWKGADPARMARAFQEILCHHRFPGNYAGHPVLGAYDANDAPAEEPVPEDGHRFDLIHPRKKGGSFCYSVSLSMAEIEDLKEKSPVSSLTLNQWLPMATTMLGMNGGDLDRVVFHREGVVAYLLKAFDEVQDGRLRWEDLAKPVSLTDDRLGIR